MIWNNCITISLKCLILFVFYFHFLNTYLLQLIPPNNKSASIYKLKYKKKYIFTIYLNKIKNLKKY